MVPECTLCETVGVCYAYGYSWSSPDDQETLSLIPPKMADVKPGPHPRFPPPAT
jgi:hypothetical protein